MGTKNVYSFPWWRNKICWLFLMTYTAESAVSNHKFVFQSCLNNLNMCILLCCIPANFSFYPWFLIKGIFNSFLIPNVLLWHPRNIQHIKTIQEKIIGNGESLFNGIITRYSNHLNGLLVLTRLCQQIDNICVTSNKMT